MKMKDARREENEVKGREVKPRRGCCCCCLCCRNLESTPINTCAVFSAAAAAADYNCLADVEIGRTTVRKNNDKVSQRQK